MNEAEFFRWFAFVEADSRRAENGNTIVTFRPSGEKFRALVKLEVVLDRKSAIDALRLSLSKSFVDDPKQGIFARDIAKSFLRSALPEPDKKSIARLAGEIEWRHSFPVLVRSSTTQSLLPSDPSEGFLAYLGQRKLYEETYSESSLRIEHKITEEGEMVTLTARRGR